MKREDYELPLLQSILELGGSVTPSDELYEKVASKMRLTDKELGYDKVHAKPRWIYELQWVRQTLVDKGDLGRSRRGVWKMTEQGRQRILKGNVKPPVASTTEGKDTWASVYGATLDTIKLADVFDRKALLALRALSRNDAGSIIEQLLFLDFKTKARLTKGRATLSVDEQVSFQKAWHSATNRLARELVSKFATQDGTIDWRKLLLLT